MRSSQLSFIQAGATAAATASGVAGHGELTMTVREVTCRCAPSTCTLSYMYLSRYGRIDS